MRKIAVVVAVLGLAIAIYVSMRRGAARRGQDLESASLPKAPALTLVDLNGNRISTSSYQGNVVLINFWAAWCTPCTEEVPKLVALEDKYRARGLRVIGISMEDRESALCEFYQKNKMNYPVIIGTQKIAEAYGGILGLPTTLLISRDGRIRARHPGLADFTKLEQEIVALLQANP